MLLCCILKKIVPDHVFSGLNRKARTFKAAEHNIEQAYACLSKFSYNSRRIPSPRDVFSGKRQCIARLLVEIFEAVGMKVVRQRSKQTFLWLNKILGSYKLPIHRRRRSTITARGSLWKEFSSAVRMWCVIHYYFNDDIDDPKMMKRKQIYQNPEVRRRYFQLKC